MHNDLNMFIDSILLFSNRSQKTPRCGKVHGNMKSIRYRLNKKKEMRVVEFWTSFISRHYFI